MSDVACVCCAPLVGEVRARGLEPERLVEGLDLHVSDLENVRNRIPWDSFRVFARRSADLLGGTQEIEEVAARSAAQAVPSLIRRMLPRIGSTRLIYVIGARWWGPWVFRGTRATCEELADGRLREVIEIPPGYGDCPEFFQGLRGVIRAMPRMFGQPEAVVGLSQDGRRGEFVITPPPRRRRAHCGVRRRAPISAEVEDFEELGFRQEQLLQSLRQTPSSTEPAARTAQLRDRPVLVAGPVRPGARIASRPEDSAEVDLNEVIRTLAPRLRLLVRGGIELDVSWSKGLAPLSMDPGTVEQALLALVRHLCEIGSSRIRISTRSFRAVKREERAREGAALEVSGDGVAANAGASVLEHVDLSGFPPPGATVDVRSDSAGGTSIRIRLALRGAPEHEETA